MLCMALRRVVVENWEGCCPARGPPRPSEATEYMDIRPFAMVMVVMPGVDNHVEGRDETLFEVVCFVKQKAGGDVSKCRGLESE